MTALRFLTTALAISTLTVFTACKKERIEKQFEKQAVSVDGLWTGGCYKSDDTPAQVDLKIRLNNDGKLDKLSSVNEKEAEGTWTIEGTQFNAVYQDLPLKMVVYSVTGYYDAASKKITGTYVNSAMPGTTLHFTITKQ